MSLLLLSASTDALESIRIKAIPSCPFSEAQCKGVQLLLAALSTSAPPSMRKRTISSCPSLEALCRSADVVIPCAGVPGLVTGDWIRPGGAVVNVGTTYCAQSGALQPDLEAELEGLKGKLRAHYSAWVISLTRDQLANGIQPEEVKIPMDIPTYKTNLFCVSVAVQER